MSATFRINQDGVIGAWNTARQDLQLFSVGGVVTLEAQDAGEANYFWEIISEPEGSSIVVSGSTTPVATVSLTVTGGYIVRLITNEGLPTKDVREYYMGVPLTGSGLAIPAFNETVQDNSEGTSYFGYERKLTRILKWIDQGIGGTSYWTRLGTTLSPSFAGDNVDIVSTSSDFTPLVLTNTAALGAGNGSLGIQFVTSFDPNAAQIAIRGEDDYGASLFCDFRGVTELQISPGRLRVGPGTVGDQVLDLNAAVGSSGSFITFSEGGVDTSAQIAYSDTTSILGITTLGDIAFTAQGQVTNFSSVSNASLHIGFPESTVLGALNYLYDTWYRKIINPVADFTTLTASDDGALVLTSNTTAGKDDTHTITLPAPSEGLTFTISRNDDFDPDVTLNVGTPASELMIFNDKLTPDGWITEETQVYLLGKVRVVAFDSTRWTLIQETGSIGFNYTSSSGPGVEYHPVSPFTVGVGAGNSEQANTVIRGPLNEVNTGNYEQGTDGYMFGVAGELIGARSQTWGWYAKAREGWGPVKSVGLASSNIINWDDTPGQIQRSSGVLQEYTEDATPTVLKASAFPPQIPINMCMIIEGRVLAKGVYETAASCKSWIFDALIKNNNSGTPTLVSYNITLTGQDSPAESSWDFSLNVAPGTHDVELQVVVTGEVSRDIVWVCTYETAEVNMYTIDPT